MIHWKDVVRRFLLQCFVLCLATSVFAEPAMDALIKDSPLIVVGEPVFENGIAPIGAGMEVVFIKYSITFKIKRVLKSDSTLEVGDNIRTRLALYMEGSDAKNFEPKEGKPVILFLRRTGENSFENTSTWFGVMADTWRRERQLEAAIKASAKGESGTIFHM